MPLFVGQRLAQRFHRGVVVDAVERDEILQLRAEREVERREVAHRHRSPAGAARSVRPACGMLGIHRGVHPDVLDPDVLE